MQHHSTPAELDGKQVLDFYWTDPIDAIKRFVAKRQYKDKLYTTFQPGTTIFHPNDRAFDKANSGMVFQGSYLVDSGSSPLLALFYADASFSGQSMSHHPIYSMFVFIVIIMVIISLIHIILQCVCSICMRMSDANQETGFRSAGFQCMMKAGTNVRPRGSIPLPPANIDCTISVG